MTDRDRLTERGDALRGLAERPMGSITFIVRVSTDEVGRLVGIVEHVRTGRKEQFEGREAIGSVIASLLPTAECSNPRQRRRGRA